MPRGVVTVASPAVLALVQGLYRDGTAGAIRRDANISIRQFARLAETSKSSIAGYENGHHPVVDAETARRLLNALRALGLATGGFE